MHELDERTLESLTAGKAVRRVGKAPTMHLLAEDPRALATAVPPAIALRVAPATAAGCPGGTCSRRGHA